MPVFSGCSIELVLPQHNPNEGREIINENFKCIEQTIEMSISAVTTGNTIVEAGSNVVISGPGAGSIPPLYIVNLDDDIVLNSISATTISADTYYVGDVPLTAITSGLTYTNLTPTPTTIGGIDAGTTFNNKTMQEMWDMLLYPYQYPSFTSFSINGQSTVLEVGDSVPSGSTLFTWSTSNSSNVSASTIYISDITNSTSLATGLVNDGSESIVLPFDVTKTTATSNQWRIGALNTEGDSFTRNFNVNWRWRIHYGESVDTTLDADGITGLTSSQLSSGYAGTWSFDAGGYKYFAYPSLMGTATTFKDSLTNLDVAMETLYTTAITNSLGVSTTYNVHRTTNVLGSSIDIIIS